MPQLIQSRKWFGRDIGLIMFKALQYSQDSGCSLNCKKLQNLLLAFRCLDDKLLTGQYFIDMHVQFV